MKPFDDLLERAQRDPRHIVLPEGEDPRVAEGAIRAACGGIAQVTFLGRAERVRELLRERDGRSSSAVMIDPETSPDLDRFAEEHHERRRHKGMDAAKARELLRQPLCFGSMMVRLGRAEGSVAGAASTTADTVQAALQVIGTDPRYSLCPASS